MKAIPDFCSAGALLGGFLLLFATTYMSGYWTETNLAEVKKLFVVFAKTLQYSYLFGIVPSLMLVRWMIFSGTQKNRPLCGC